MTRERNFKKKYNKRRTRKRPQQPVVEVRGRIDALGVGGDGQMLVDLKRINVPFTMIGDEGRFAVRGHTGELAALEKSGPLRTEPLCKHHGQCGGCQLQHVNLEYYKAWKTDLVRKVMAREGFGEVPILPLLSSPLRSRRRAGFAVKNDGGYIHLGFHAPASHNIVKLTECHILHPDIFSAIPVLRKVTALLLPTSGSQGSLFVTYTETGLDLDFKGDVREDKLTLQQREGVTALLHKEGIVRLTIDRELFFASGPASVTFGGIPVVLPPHTFLQATLAGEKTLQTLALEGVGSTRHVVDLFAGCGTLSLPILATAHAKLHAVEGDAPAMAALTAAVQGRFPQNHVTTETRDLFNQPLMPEELRRFDAAIFDPPRAGAEAQVTQLAKSSVPLIIGVSCNVKTFARDARLLVNGGYKIIDVQPVDQFLFTPHIEVVGRFVRS